MAEEHLEYMLRDEEWPIDRIRCAEKLHMGLTKLQQLYRASGHYSRPGRKVVFSAGQFVELWRLTRAPKKSTAKSGTFGALSLGEDSLREALALVPPHKPRQKRGYKQK